MIQSYIMLSKNPKCYILNLFAGPGIDQLRFKLDKLAPRFDEYSDVVNEQFIIMFKFLAFAASAAEAPVPQNMTKEINKRVQKSGNAKNIKTWMFWTPPQLEMLFNSHWVRKVCFISGNGVGKTVIMLEQATTLVKMGKSVLFCIKRHENWKSLLQMRFENHFEGIGNVSGKVNVLGISKIEDIQTQPDLRETHIFIDECSETWISSLNDVPAKSIWIALGELESFQNQKSMCIRNIKNNLVTLLEEFKNQYGSWYFPYNNLTLRATQTISKEFKTASKKFSEPDTNGHEDNSAKSTDKLMIGSLNKYLNFPNNTQAGPEPNTNDYGKGRPKHDYETLTDILKNLLLADEPRGASQIEDTNNIQLGPDTPEPKTENFETFVDNLEKSLLALDDEPRGASQKEDTKIQKGERLLIVIEWQLGVNSEELDEAEKFIDNNLDYNVFKGSANKIDGNFSKILIVVLNILQKCKRTKPLIWLQEHPSYCSDEMDIKKWIDGKEHCDLITDSRSIRGFEEPVVLHLGESHRMFGEDILPRSIVKFFGISYDNPKNNKMEGAPSPYNENLLKDMTISYNVNDANESDQSKLKELSRDNLTASLIRKVESGYFN